MKKTLNVFITCIFIMSMIFIKTSDVDAATSIALGHSYTADVDDENQSSFKFTLKTSGRLSVNAKANDEFKFKIYDEDGNELCRFDSSYNDALGYHEKNIFGYYVSGSYYIKFSRQYDWIDPGGIDFRLGFNGSYATFLDSQSNKHDVIDKANSITLNKTYKGVICDNDDKDMYKFSMPYASTLYLDMTAFTGNDDIKLQIFNEKGNEIGDLGVGYIESKGYRSDTDSIYLSKGIYYFRVFQDYINYSDGYFYKFKLRLFTGSLTKLTVTNMLSCTKLSWSKVTRASGYRIYRRSGTTGSYKLIKTITNGSTVYYYDKTNLTNGQRYYYKVVPFNSYGTGGSLARSLVRLTKTPITSLKKTAAKKMKVTYSKNSKASGYIIKYSTNKNYKNEKKIVIKKNSTVSRTIGSLTSGKTYYVKVRSYKKVGNNTYYSAYSESKSVKI